MSDTNTNTPNPAAPAATPATPPKAEGTPATPAAGSTPAAAPANASPNAPTAADPASTAPDADAAGSPGDGDGEPSATEKEVLAIAREKAKLRSEREKLKDTLTQAEKLRKADELRAKGDYVGAMEVMGWDPDEFYVKSTDQIVNREKKVVDPAEVAREEAKRLIKEAEEAREKAANAKADRQWMSGVETVLDADYDKYPDVVRALATGKINKDDLLKYAYGAATAKADSSPEGVLGAFQSHLAPKKKVTPAATPKDAAKASGDSTPSAGTNTQAPPSALNSNAPVKPEFEDTGTVDGNYRAMMAKLGYSLPPHY